jgi:enhancer of mRNA-decapping protein 4
MKTQLAEHARDLAKARADAASVEKEKMGRLLKVITDTLSTSIATKVSAAVEAEGARSLVPAIAHALNDKVMSGKVTQALSMGFNQMNASVKSYIPKLITSADVTSGLAAAVAQAVKAPVVAAMTATFQQSVVPAVQSGCQEMFRQVDAQLGAVGETAAAAVAAAAADGSNRLGSTEELEAIVGKKVAEGYRQQQAGIATLLAESQRATLQSLHAHAEAVVGIVKEGTASSVAMASAVQSAMSGAGAAGAIGQKAAGAVGSSSPNPPKELTSDEKVMLCVAQGKYLDAFSTALGAQDLAVVMRLCKKVEPSFLFSLEPMPLTEPVILSLIAQLTTDLKDDTDFKIAYLQEVRCAISNRESCTRGSNWIPRMFA